MKNDRYRFGATLSMALTILALYLFGLPSTAVAQLKSDQGIPSSSGKAQGDVPVIVLSEQLGDAGVAASASTSVSLPAELVTEVPFALVYADVDSIKDREAAISALRKARAREFPIVLESFSWDVAKLHAFATAFAPELDLKQHQNVALELSVQDGRFVATDTTPSRTAMLLGVPFEQTDEGRSERAEASSRAPIDWLAPFASLAYQTNPGTPYQHFFLVTNLDVLKIWIDDNSIYDSFALGDCVVSFRGSTDIGDWLRNGQSQFTFGAYPYPTYSWWGLARIGGGWRSRLDNIYNHVESVLDLCQSVHVTGHSLGGAMGSSAGFRISKTSPYNNTVYLAVFNPARVGNSYFKSEYNSDAQTTTPRIYCRHGDPVYWVPTGFEHIGNGSGGCTIWGDQVAAWGSTANHNMDLWL